MPYAISFRKPVEVTDPEQYINDCCIGGDLVLAQILPGLKPQYEGIETNQEDWGWFAWIEKSGVKLAVDIFDNDPAVGEFQMHATSRKPRFFLSSKVADTPELEELRNIIVRELEAWPVGELAVERIDERYLPLNE